MNWYIEVLKKYAVLTGRARRKEYWYFYLFSILSAIVLGIVDGVAGSSGLFGELYALVIVDPPYRSFYPQAPRYWQEWMVAVDPSCATRGSHCAFNLRGARQSAG